MPTQNARSANRWGLESLELGNFGNSKETRIPLSRMSQAFGLPENEDFNEDFFAYLEIAQYSELRSRFPALAGAELMIVLNVLSIAPRKLHRVDEILAIEDELAETIYYLTGCGGFNLYFCEELLYQKRFGVSLKSVVEEVSRMPATLEKPVENAPLPVPLPITNSTPETEDLYTIEDLIHQISNRTGMTAESIQATIELLNFKRYRTGSQILISASSVNVIMNRWAEAVAGDVRAQLYAEATRPTPIPKTVANTTKKAPAKKTAAKRAAKPSSAGETAA